MNLHKMIKINRTENNKSILVYNCHMTDTIAFPQVWHSDLLL